MFYNFCLFSGKKGEKIIKVNLCLVLFSKKEQLQFNKDMFNQSVQRDPE